MPQGTAKQVLVCTHHMQKVRTSGHLGWLHSTVDSQELSHTLQDESDPRAEGGTPVPWEGPLSVENPLIKHSVTVTKL